MDHELTTEQIEAEEKAAFDAAFNADEPDEERKPPTDEVAETPESKPAESSASAPAASANASAPAESTAVADPFASLPPQVREVLALVPDVQRDLKRTAGMVSALQSENAKLRNQLAGMQTASQAPAAAPAIQEPAELDEVRHVREQGLPEVADAIQAAVRAAINKPAAGPAPAPAASSPAPAASAAESSVDQHLAEEANALKGLHPDWDKKMTSSDFRLWLSTQGSDYADKVMSTDRAIVVAEALTRFEKHHSAARQAAESAAALAGKRNARAAAAVELPRGGAAPANKQVNDEQAAFLAGFNEG